MADGLVPFVHRKSLEEEREQKAAIDFSKLKGHQQYLRYTEYTPRSGDKVIAEGAKVKEQKHDTFLRKFEHTKALDCVLMPMVTKKYPEYTFSVLKELQR